MKYEDTSLLGMTDECLRVLANVSLLFCLSVSIKWTNGPVVSWNRCSGRSLTKHEYILESGSTIRPLVVVTYLVDGDFSSISFGLLLSSPLL